MSKTQHALENLHEHNSQGCGHDHHHEDESGHNDNSACGCGHEHYHKGESGHDHDAACGCGHDHHVPGHADDCQCELCHPHEEYCDVCGESLENCICRMPDAVYNPFNVSSVPPSQYSPSSYQKQHVEWEPLFQGLEKKGSSSWDMPASPIPDETWSEPEQQPEPMLYDEHAEGAIAEKSAQHYQYKGSYILTSVKSGLMIIDQQRAHIRILYDQYMNQIANRRNVSQRMLFPDMVHFSPAEIPVLEEIMDDLTALGFELSNLGGGSYAINGIPAGIEGLNPETLVTNMVQTAIEKGCKVKEEVQSMLALSLAKAAAIVPGQVLTNEEMNNLVDELFAVSTPNYTPDGKVVLSVLKEDDLEKLFK